MGIKRIFKHAAVIALTGVGLAMTSGNAAASCGGGSSPYIGSICGLGIVGFCPRGYAEADGQLLQIIDNQALFSLFGTIYGGDGRTTFALPDLRGRSPVHTGQGAGLSNIPQGQKGGAENTTLSSANLSHTHSAMTNVTVDVTSALRANSAAGDDDDPTDNVLARRNRTRVYSTGAPDVAMSADAITTTTTTAATTMVASTGGSQSFDNRSPYLGIRYCVALTGQFPSRL